MRRPGLVPLLVLVARAAHAVCDPSPIVLADPATFSVKRCWTATDLGVPIPLGGLRFSADGATLYVIGGADSSSSAINALPVSRDAVTGEVTALATPAMVLPASSPTGLSGLDAALEVGPSGTVFVTYFGVDAGNQDISVVAERPGGVGGSETKFDLVALSGLTQSAGGLTFSPLRTDPATGFGRMQVSVGLGAIYDIALAPASPGLFTPGAKQLFVVVQPGGMGAIQYVPAGPLAHDLFYTSLDEGSVHRLTIDSASGLPIDTVTMMPTQGTSSPDDAMFASGFSPGPIGLAFDPSTGGNDAFVTTGDFVGTTVGAIYQIGGFAPAAVTTTTTTLPPGCPSDASFPSVDCRLGELLAAVDAAPLARFQAGLHASVERCRTRASDAAARVAAHQRRGAKRSLGKAIHALSGFKTRLGSRAVRHAVPLTVRAPLADRANAILRDLRTLSSGV